jgi:Plasma-membrane choline transporter
VSVGVSFLYLYVLRIPGLMFTVVWTAVLSILAVLVAACLLLWQLALSWEQGGVKSDTEVLVVKIFMWIFVGLAGLYFCLVLVLRKRIMLALGIIKEAGRALATMPSLIFLPVVQCFGLVCFLVPWFIYM